MATKKPFISQSSAAPRVGPTSPKVQSSGVSPGINFTGIANQLNISTPKISGGIKPALLRTPKNIGAETKAATQFSKVFIETAFRVQDEKNALKAEQTLYGVKEKLRKITYSEGGYLSTSGEQAVMGYEAYESSIDKIYEEELEKADPAVREKLIKPLASQREAYLGRAGSHAQAQRSIWEKDVKSLGENDLRETIGEILPDADLTHQTISSTLERLYPSKVKGYDSPGNILKQQKLYNELAEYQIDLLMHTPGGIPKAVERYESLKPLIAPSTELYIVKTLQKGIDHQNSEIAANQAKQEKLEKASKRRAMDKITAAEIKGEKIYSPVEIGNLLEQNIVDRSFAHAYLKRAEARTSGGDSKDVTDWRAYNDLGMELLEYAVTDFERPDGSSVIEDIYVMEASDTEIKQLLNKANSLKLSKNKQDYKNAIDTIKVLGRGENDWIGGAMFKKETEVRIANMTREFITRIEKGEKYRDVLGDFQGLYGSDQPQVSISAYPAFADGSTPTTLAELNTTLEKVRNMDLTDLEDRQQRVLFSQYKKRLLSQ